MPEPSKAYMDGEMRALEEDAGIGTPGPFSNPYDDHDEPEAHFEFQCGYNNSMANLRKQRAEEGSWYPEHDDNDEDWR